MLFPRLILARRSIATYFGRTLSVSFALDVLLVGVVRCFILSKIARATTISARTAESHYKDPLLVRCYGIPLNAQLSPYDVRLGLNWPGLLLRSQHCHLAGLRYANVSTVEDKHGDSAMAPVVYTQDVKLCNTQLLDPIPGMIQAVALHHRHTATDFLVQFFDPTGLAGALGSYEQVQENISSGISA